jgi:hypothetical protein
MSDHLCLRQIKLLISIVLTLFLGAAQADPVSCKVEAPPFLKSSQLIVLGELHGTREIPKFVSLLACSIKLDPVRLAIAFELPVDEGERITNLIRSKSSRSERKAFFRKSAYWNSVPNDGRRSSAIIELIDGLIEVAQKDDQLHLIFFDGPTIGYDTEITRESYFNSNFTSEFLKFRAEQAIVLIGGLHAAKFSELAEKTLKSQSPQDSKRTGSIVLMASYNSGTAWNCSGFTIETLVCGKSARGDSRHFSHTTPNEITLIDTADKFFDGFYFVGKITASPPLLGK